MPDINAANIAPHSSPLPPHLTPYALQHLANAPGTPTLTGPASQELGVHSQVLDLLRTHPRNQDRQEALADFIKQHNDLIKKSPGKQKHAPKFSSVKEEDMQKIQSFCANGNTDAIHALMRKKGWKTLTLILGDDVVTLCRPKNKKGDMQYVRNCVDAGEDRTEIDTGNNGRPLKLDDHPDILELLAGQLMQRQDVQGVTNGIPAPQQINVENLTEVILPRFDGHLNLLRLGVHHVKNQTPIPS